MWKTPKTTCFVSVGLVGTGALVLDQISIPDLLITSHNTNATGTFKAAKQPQTRRCSAVFSSHMITSIIPSLSDDWYPTSPLISSFLMNKPICLWKDWSYWISLHLSQGRRRSSVTSKITCRAAVAHSPTSISDIRAVFHLWATYVILNIAKGEGYTESRQLLCLLFFCTAFDLQAEWGLLPLKTAHPCLEVCDKGGKKRGWNGERNIVLVFNLNIKHI